MKVGPSIVDYMTGMNTSIGILAALYHRDANGGEGQHVDVCLFDTVIASLSHWAQIYLVNGKTPPRRGTWGNGGMPAGVFRCTDGELMLVVGNDGQFARTCAVLGEPELANDPKFVKNNDRVVHGKEIMAIFAGLFLKKPVAYWLEELEKAGVPSGPINDFAQVFADPHVRSRGMEIKVDHPFEPQLSLIRNPITFSGTPVKDYRAPPLLGANTKEVLARKLGYDDAQDRGAEDSKGSSKAFSSEVCPGPRSGMDTGPRQECASKQRGTSRGFCRGIVSSPSMIAGGILMRLPFARIAAPLRWHYC